MWRKGANRSFARFRETGDPRALAQVFDATAAELARVAVHLTGDAHRAEDLVQSTFLVAMESAGDWDRDQPVLPWLLGILANRARILRREERRTLDARRVATSAVTEDPVQSAQDAEFRERLHASLLQLPSPYREVVSLHLLHGLSAREIAEVLGAPAGTVRTQIVRGMERLRRVLPVGLAGLAVASGAPALSLARAREAVLRQAGSAGVATAAALAGGVLVMNKLVASVVVVAAAGAAWFGWSSTRPGPPQDAAIGGTTGGQAPAAFASATENGEDALQVERTRDPGDVAAPAALGPAPSLVTRVVFEAGQRPASSAGVRLWPGERPLYSLREARTDASGSAHWFDLEPGTWTAQADRGGEPVSVTVQPDATETVELVIPAGVQVSGRVVDEGERPVPGAGIWLSCWPAGIDDGQVVAETDAAGRFTLEHVEPGRSVAALKEGFLRGYCTAIEGVPGDALELELRLARGSENLRGIVLDPSGDPVAGAAVMAGYSYGGRGPRMAPSWPGMRTWTGEDGTFDFGGVLPGTSLPLWARGEGFAVYRTQVELASEGETSVTVRLEPGARVHGTVSDASGNPLEGVTVHALQDDVEPGVGMGWGGPEWARVQGFTDAAGRYEILHVKPGKTTLRCATEAGSARLEMVLADGDDWIWHAVLASELKITGIVQDESGNPLPGMSVWTRGGKKGVPNPESCETDAEGRFELEPCEDLPYEVFVRHVESNMHRGDWSVPDVRPGPPVTITVPSHRIADCYFTGLVHDDPGQEGELRISLNLLNADGTREFAGGRPSFQGEHFRIGPVIPGRYEVTLSRGALFVEAGAFEVRPGDTCDIGIHSLPEPGFVELEVRDVDGSPLPSSRFLLKIGESTWGDVVDVLGGGGVSKEKAPGTYTVQPFGRNLPLFSTTVEVRPGETARVEIQVPPHVSRKMVLPPVAHDGTLRTITWWDGEGRLVCRSTGVWDATQGYETEQAFTPGSYRVEVRNPDGARAEATFVIEDTPSSDQVIRLPDPHE